MYYRVEIQTFPHPAGIGHNVEGWQGVFRPGSFYYELLERGAQDDESSARLWRYCHKELPVLPRQHREAGVQSWFTELGYMKFEEVADLFLLALSYMPEAKDIRVLERDFSQDAVLYEDEYQVAIAA